MRTLWSVKPLLYLRVSGTLGRMSESLRLGAAGTTQRWVAWGPKSRRGPGLRGRRPRSRYGWIEYAGP